MASLKSKTYLLPPLVSMSTSPPPGAGAGAGASSSIATAARRGEKRVSGEIDDSPLTYETVFKRTPSIISCVSDRKFIINPSRVILGKGSWGTVYSGCAAHIPAPSGESKEIKDIKDIKMSDCNYAIKVFELRFEDDEITDHPFEVPLREVYYLKMLQNIQLDGKPIVPHLYDYFACNIDYIFVITMEKYDFDMVAYGMKMYDEYPNSRFFPRSSIPISNLLYTDLELIRMFQIAQLLTQYGIFNSDLSPSQYLIRKSDGNIAITDFGLSGDINKPNLDRNKFYFKPIMGWMQNAKLYQCKMQIPPSGDEMKKAEIKDAIEHGEIIFNEPSSFMSATHPSIRSAKSAKSDTILTDFPTLAKWFNIWQLSTHLTVHQTTFVQDSETGEIKLFTGFHIPPKFFKEVVAFCPLFEIGAKVGLNDYVRNYYELDMESIGFRRIK